MRRVAKIYTFLAVIVFNTLILLIAGLLILQLGLDRSLSKPIYSRFFNLDSYVLTDETTVKQLWAEFDQMGERESYAFNPWTTFQESPYSGKFLTVLPGPITTTRGTQTPAPKDGRTDLVVWMFGGSTMFGWGVPDNQTIASHLQDELQGHLPNRRVVVTNYGHSYYFSSQEVALFVALLRGGEHPDIVTFIDGLNETIEPGNGLTEPYFAELARTAWEAERIKVYSSNSGGSWFSPSFPPFRLVQNQAAELAPPPQLSILADPVKTVIDTYHMNRQIEAAVAQSLGIAAYFFWQPVPYYGSYVDTSVSMAPPQAAVGAYDSMTAEARSGTVPGFYTLDTLLLNTPRPYLDSYHYSDKSCLVIAQHMAEIIAGSMSSENAPR